MAEPVTLSLRHTFRDAGSAFARAPEILREELVQAATIGSLLLEREVRERTPTSGAGTLRDSIGALPVTIAGPRVSSGVGTALAYAAPVETGSRPHMPPVEPIAEWVRRKLGKKPKEARGIAFAIARKIARDGTQGAHMFAQGLDFARPQIIQLLEAAYASALSRVAS